MRGILTGILALLGLLGGSAITAAAELDVSIHEKVEPLSEIERDAVALAEKIDALIEARYKDKKVQPAPLSDDAEFLRRAYLDLNGRIPGIGLARDFPQMSYKHKRLELLRQLLKDPRYVKHFTNVYRSILLPPLGNDFQQQQFQFTYNQFDQWMKRELERPLARWDRIARGLLMGPQSGAQDGPGAFYQANEYKVENLASSTSRLFLGFKLECAQCHDHPFAKWSRKQFWEYAAFFGGIAPRSPMAAKTRELDIPGTKKKAQARFPDGKEPKFEDGADSRSILADWMTARENPYFAKAMANRTWEYFFGTGLVEPIEEPSDDNPPSHPELLELIAKEFADHQYDLRFLTLAITATRTYQLSSALTDDSQRDHHVFARAVARGLSAEQVLESMARAASHNNDPLNLIEANDPRVRRLGMQNTPRSEFLNRFPHQAKKTEAATSILQALFMMNSRVTAEMISTKDGGNLDWLIKGKSVKTARKVEQLYMMTLTRLPRAEESERLVEYIDKGGPSGDSKQALSDVFWALLNCSEFALNH